MNIDTIFSIVIISSMIIGVIWSFWIAYRMIKYDKKNNPNKTYTYWDVIAQQGEIGSVLSVFPIVGIIIDILVELFFYYWKTDKTPFICKFLNKKI